MASDAISYINAFSEICLSIAKDIDNGKPSERIKHYMFLVGIFENIKTYETSINDLSSNSKIKKLVFKATFKGDVETVQMLFRHGAGSIFFPVKRYDIPQRWKELELRAKAYISNY